MTNYKNGVIYKICCKDENIKDVYVGSSCSHTKRKSAHKRACTKKDNKEYNYPVYRYIRDNGGWENWDFVLLEEYPCENKNQLVIRERYWFELLGTKLNSQYPERTKKEYYEENKEKILTQKKEYSSRPEVKTIKKEYNKGYYEENKEEIIEKAKGYYEENKEEIIEKAREYREKNKEKINEKVQCECGSVVCRRNLTRHKKSQKHQNYLKKLSEEEKDN